MRSGIWVCGMALLALGACSKKPETPAGGPTETAAAPAAALPTTPPDRKAGLWEQTMTSDRSSQVIQMCLDETVGKKMSLWGQQMGKSTCSKNEIKARLGGGWEFSSSCDMGAAGHIESHGAVTGDMSTHYVADIESTTSGSPMTQANGPHKMKMDAAWKGPCPANMRAGDIAMPGGMKINILDAMDAQAAGPDGKAPSAERVAQMRKMMESMKKGAPQ